MIFLCARDMVDEEGWRRWTVRPTCRLYKTRAAIHVYTLSISPNFARAGKHLGILHSGLARVVHLERLFLFEVPLLLSVERTEGEGLARASAMTRVFGIPSQERPRYSNRANKQMQISSIAGRWWVHDSRWRPISTRDFWMDDCVDKAGKKRSCQLF